MGFATRPRTMYPADVYVGFVDQFRGTPALWHGKNLGPARPVRESEEGTAAGKGEGNARRGVYFVVFCSTRRGVSVFLRLGRSASE